MKLLDVNLLLYAVNRDSPRHAAAKPWLERALTGDEPVGFAWSVILAFIRISTNARIMSKPLRSEQAVSIVDEWLSLPAVTLVSPGDEHWRIIRGLLNDAGAAGNLASDAHLAALAIETGADLCSTDTDFARFPKVRWTNPLAV